MERVIKVNGVEVVKGLCTVGFKIDGNMFLMSQEATHAEVYRLLDEADEVVTGMNGEGIKSGAIAIAKHGAFNIAIYKK